MVSSIAITYRAFKSLELRFPPHHCSATPLSLISKKRISCLSTRFKLFSYLLNAFQAEWSVVSYRCDDGESVHHFSASLLWKICNAQSHSCYKDLLNLLDRSRQPIRPSARTRTKVYPSYELQKVRILR